MASKIEIRAGDHVMFVRITLRDIRRHVRAAGWRALLPDLLGWLSNWIIALNQRLIATGPQGQSDGFWEVIHSGVVIETDGAGTLGLLESTAARHPDRGGNGLRISPLRERLATYPGIVYGMHLSADQQSRFDGAEVAGWWADHYEDQYRWGGLPFALLLSAIAWPWAGGLFCSEAVAMLLLYLGIIPPQLPVLRGKRRAMAGFKPECISPAELARLEPYSRLSLYVMKAALLAPQGE